MAEEHHWFSNKEVAELLIKQQGLHEGFWRLAVEFGFGAGNAGPSQEQVYPVAFVAVQRMGLTRTTIEDAAAIDAGKVNPGQAPS
jgi:hypothetical protein